MLTNSEPMNDQMNEDDELLKAAMTEVERYRSMDRLIPSFQNAVTVAALEVRTSIHEKDRYPFSHIVFHLVPHYVSHGELDPGRSKDIFAVD